MKGGIQMNIGDKILIDDGINTADTRISEIVQIIPTKYMDDGENQWYEVVDPINAKIMLVKCISKWYVQICMKD